jgi:hypothetical protein
MILRKRKVLVVMSFFLTTWSATVNADIFTIGTRTGYNGYPFGGHGEHGDPAGTRYQQVYAASNFPTPIYVNTVRFFQDNGTEQTATYNMYLSTSNNPVDKLDRTDFDNNVGSDNQFFASVTLTGASLSYGTPLNFTGLAFMYDPANGDLLVDIHASGTTYPLTGYYFAMNGDAGGLFSRAHNFGSGYFGYGLITEIDGAIVPVPDAVLLAILGLSLAGWKLRKFA